MHLLVGSRKRFEIVGPHSVQFQLERRSWLQMSVDAVLFETVAMTIREELGELLRLESYEGDPTYTARLQLFFVSLAKVGENFAHRRIVHVSHVLYSHVQDVYRLLDKTILLIHPKTNEKIDKSTKNNHNSD